jgi:hypothetical protein
MERRFAPTTAFLMGGLLIWIFNFGFVYVFAALACARGFAHVHVMGLNIVPVVTTLATLLSAAATILLVIAARRRDRTSSPAEPNPAEAETRSVISFVTVATSGIALVALVWLALPPLVTAACTR